MKVFRSARPSNSLGPTTQIPKWPRVNPTGSSAELSSTDLGRLEGEQPAESQRLWLTGGGSMPRQRKRRSRQLRHAADTDVVISLRFQRHGYSVAFRECFGLQATRAHTVIGYRRLPAPEDNSEAAPPRYRENTVYSFPSLEFRGFGECLPRARVLEHVR